MVTEGPFQYVRHPIYLAGIPLLAGIYLLYANWNWADLVAAVIAVALVHIQVVRREEPKLRGRFGASYEEYCRRVPRWMPRF